MTNAERQDAFVLGESGLARFVGFAIGLSVAVSGYRSVTPVCDGKMNEFFMGFLLIASFKGICTPETVASGHPMPFAFLGIDDGVKDNAIRGLQGNDSTGPLVELSSLTHASRVLSLIINGIGSEHRRLLHHERYRFLFWPRLWDDR